MGYEVGNGGLSVMGAYEANVLERICADHFYGMDIDHPSGMGFQYHGNKEGYINPTRLGAGLRPPTWCFMLSPLWQRKLGKSESEVRAALADPRIRITAIPYATNAHNPLGASGLWIELGELALYPVEEGVPELLRKANALIRPIRCDELNLNSLDPWDDDPNPRFDYESSQRWVGRFDDASNWPSAAVRQQTPNAGQALAEPPPSKYTGTMAYAGDPCPQTGRWQAPRLNNRIEQVEKGQPMPGQKSTQTGTVIWYLLRSSPESSV